jgi:hypothetical protein
MVKTEKTPKEYTKEFYFQCFCFQLILFCIQWAKYLLRYTLNNLKMELYTQQ